MYGGTESKVTAGSAGSGGIVRVACTKIRFAGVSNEFSVCTSGGIGSGGASLRSGTVSSGGSSIISAISFNDDNVGSSNGFPLAPSFGPCA